MQAVIEQLLALARFYKNSATMLRAERHHIAATKDEKLARNYRTAAKLLALIYPSKKSKTTDH